MSLDDPGVKADRPPQPPPNVSTSYQPVEVNDTGRPAPLLRREPEPAPPPEWREGDYVLAPWEPMFLYPGVIKRITVDEARGDQALISFDDGGEGTVFLYSLCEFELKTGQQIQVRRNNGSHFTPAEVLEVSDEEVRVRFVEGGSEWVNNATLRVPCVENGPGAVATKLTSWQTAASSAGSGFPSWATWIIIAVVLALLRIGCREMGR